MLALLLIVVFLMGGGHGMYEPAILLFPFGFIGILYSQSIELPFILIAILQYPIYGLLLDITGSRKTFKWTVVTILTLHLLLAITVLMFRGETWK